MKNLNEILGAIGCVLKPILLLAIRLYWGWHFCIFGWGKLTHLDKITGYFASLGLPMPHLQAIMAGSVECFGGAFLLLGLCARIVSVPLMFTMTVAYLAAERPALHAIFSNPDKFTGADPFLFLYAAVLIFVFGPGKISIDAIFCEKTASE